MVQLDNIQLEIREAAEADLITFARLVNPTRMYGDIHIEIMEWLQSGETNQLLLLPRAHQKSHIMAVWAAWWITKHPETTLLYVSATATLAESQLYAIKGILESVQYRRYWPEMIEAEEGKRERWNVSEIMVDHPKRKIEAVRDATIKAVGLGGTTTGLHADVLVYDDVVVPENAYTEENRRKVAASLSQFASIRNAGGITKAAGTRYHPNDQYSTFKNQTVYTYDENGSPSDKRPRWDILERVVETHGVFLWPRQYRTDGKWFGFDEQTLAEIRSEYEDRTQFFAQYYNNPEDPSQAKLTRKDFEYYKPKLLTMEDGYWHYDGERLNVFAAIDFAFSMRSTADYTSIVVIGVTADNDIYVLDIERFRTDEISKYFEAIYESYRKWEYKTLRAEVTVAQQAIVKEIKNLISKNGMKIKVDEYRPNRQEGNKEERIDSTLLPKYKNNSMYHYRGGNTQILEEELLMRFPPHDDVKDALAAAVDVSSPPLKRRSRNRSQVNTERSTGKFGGIRY